MKSPTNLTEMAPASMAPVAVSQAHHDVENGCLIVLNWDMAKKEPDMKNRSIGSRRMYLFRMRTPMSNMRSQAARKEAVSELVKFQTVRKQKGTMAQPSRVQPPLIPSQLWSWNDFNFLKVRFIDLIFSPHLVKITRLLKRVSAIISCCVTHGGDHHLSQGRVNVKEECPIDIPACHLSKMCFIPTNPCWFINLDFNKKILEPRDSYCSNLV